MTEMKLVRMDNEKLKKEVDRLIHEVSILESRLGKGEYNKQQTKVSHEFESMDWMLKIDFYF